MKTLLTAEENLGGCSLLYRKEVLLQAVTLPDSSEIVEIYYQKLFLRGP